MSPFTSPPDPKTFQSIVWDIARQTPSGKVTTYGQIAAMIPPPGTLTLKDYEAFGARWVGGAMAACPGDVPWQRVVARARSTTARGSVAASVARRRRPVRRTR